jgi:uncharacterized protein YecT (DUF1311 family)
VTIARLLASTALAVLIPIAVTGCSSSSGGSPTAASATRAAATPTAAASGFIVVTTRPAAPSSSASAPAGAPTSTSVAPADLRYVAIVEPFSAPGTCAENGNTVELTNCVLEQIEDVDSTVDSLQLARFEKAPGKQRASILKEYATWLAGRTSSCRAKATSGGSIDQITAAQCMLKGSKDRVQTLTDR